MKLSIKSFLCLVLCVPLFLSGCGLKRPLVRPEPAAKEVPG
jgi:predicted small lipoprotein YifL